MLLVTARLVSCIFHSEMEIENEDLVRLIAGCIVSQCMAQWLGLSSPATLQEQKQFTGSYLGNGESGLCARSKKTSCLRFYKALIHWCAVRDSKPEPTD